MLTLHIIRINSGNVPEPGVISESVEPTEAVQEHSLAEAEKPAGDRAVKVEKVTTSKPEAPHFLLCPSVSKTSEPNLKSVKIFLTT